MGAPFFDTFTAMSSQLQIGEVTGVHGVKGALKVRLHSVDSTALQVGRSLCLRRDEQLVQELEIERVSAKPGTDQVRLWMVDLGTRNEAEALRGCGLWMDRDALGPLPEDEYYLADLVGLSLRSPQAPELCLGKVVGVIDNRMQDLLEIEWPNPTGKATRWLLPAVGAYLEEISEEILWVDLPEGLLPAAIERALAQAVQ